MFSARKDNKKPGQRSCVRHHTLRHQSCSHRPRRRHNSESCKSLVLRKLQLRRSCRWNVTIFAVEVNDSIVQVLCEVWLILGSQEVDPDQFSSCPQRRQTCSRTVSLVICSIKSNIKSITSDVTSTASSGFAVCLQLDDILPVKKQKRNRVSDQVSGINAVF